MLRRFGSTFLFAVTLATGQTCAQPPKTQPPKNRQSAPHLPAAQPQPIPTAADLAAALPTSQQQIAGLVRQLLGAPAATMRILGLTDDAPNAASRYLLFAEALRCATHADARMIGIVVDALEKSFSIDRFAVTLAHLTAMAKNRSDAHLDLAFAYLELAHQAARHTDRDDATPRIQTALRAARQHARAIGEPSLLARIQAREPELLAIQSRWQQVTRGAEGNLGRGRVLCFLDDDWVRGLPILAPEDRIEQNALLGKGLPNPDATTCIRIADSLLTAGKRFPAATPAELRLVRRNIGSRALAHYHRAWPTATPMQRARLGRAMARLDASILEGPGPGRLRFQGADALAQLTVQECEPQLRDGALLLASDGVSETRATIRYAFRRIRSVTIRGRIHSQRNLNFRFKIGNLNAICNWELKPESHFYVADRLVSTAPPLFEKGKEHVIQVRQIGDEAVLFFDGRVVFQGKADLAGSVTVYPACGSEIAVRELLVDGDLEPTKLLEKPIGKTW